MKISVLEEKIFKEKRLLKTGYIYEKESLYLYEKIPSLLRFFHINNISPSAWVSIPKKYTKIISPSEKKQHVHSNMN